MASDREDRSVEAVTRRRAFTEGRGGVATPHPFLPPVPEARRSRKAWIRGAAIALVAVVVLVGAVIVEATLSDQRHQLTVASGRLAQLQHRLVSIAADVSDLRDRVGALEQGLPPNLVDVVAKVEPSIFIVQAGGFQGTAFVVQATDARSLLVTNFHVVASVWTSGRRDVELNLGDEHHKGRLLRVDTREDLALIAVERRLPALHADVDPPSVGDTVIVVGAPFGLEGTVADGIVSGTHKGYMQFSAPISPGNSGAPVLDEQGLVVAVATQKIVTPGAEGLSFAVPMAVVCRTILRC